MTAVTLDLDVLGTLSPLALVFDADGQVVYVGPTLSKIAPGTLGRPMSETLSFVHPSMGAVPDLVLAQTGRRLRLELRGVDGAAPESMRGLVVPLSGGGGLMALSFGGDPSQALRRHQLTAGDFSQIDPTVDLLFLLEAHGIVLHQFELLSDRLEQARDAAEKEAITDPLTGLRNRRALDFHLERLARRRVPKFGLMHLDLDHFKEVNDTLGHAAGDKVLEAVAAILDEEVRSGDLVARVGGDEFFLVFDECDDVARLERIADRIITKLEQPVDWEGAPCRISGSVGITMSDFYDRLDPKTMIADADDALYASKRAGRGRFTVAKPTFQVARAS